MKSTLGDDLSVWKTLSYQDKLILKYPSTQKLKSVQSLLKNTKIYGKYIISYHSTLFYKSWIRIQNNKYLNVTVQNVIKTNFDCAISIVV